MRTALKIVKHRPFLTLPFFIISILLVFLFSNVNGNIGSVFASSSFESFEMADGRAPGEEWGPDSDLVDPGNIAIDVRDSDIRDVLSIIAIKMDVNIIFIEEPVDVTFQVDNVPLREALELLVQKEGLNYIEDGNIIVVGSAERLQDDFFSRMELTRFDLSYITSEQLDGIIQDMGIDVETIVVEDNPESIWIQGTSFSLVKTKELVEAMDRQENKVEIDELEEVEAFQFREIRPENVSPGKLVEILQEAGVTIDGYIALETRLLIFDEEILKNWNNFHEFVVSFDDEEAEDAAFDWREIKLENISSRRAADLLEEAGLPVENFLTLGDRLIVHDEAVVSEFDNFEDFIGNIDDLDSQETTSFTFSFDNIVAEDAVERLEAYGFDDVQTVTGNLAEFSNELIVIVPPHKEDEVYESLLSIDRAGGRARAPITTARGENAWDELAAKRRLLSDMTDLSVNDMDISENISGDEDEPHHVLWTDKPADKINYLQNLVESFE